MRDLNDMREWIVVPGKRNNKCKDFEASMISEYLWNNKKPNVPIAN